MNVQELYDKACELHKEKNFDATLKILDEIKRRDPKFKEAYYLEAWIYEDTNNFVREYRALEKIFSLLKLSTPKEKNFASEILSHMADTCAHLSLLKESKEFYFRMLKTADSPKVQCLHCAIFYGNSFEDASPDYFQTFYDAYKKFWRTSCLIRKNFFRTRKFVSDFFPQVFIFTL